MRIHYELASFLVSAWRLAQPGVRLPTSHGILDRALEDLADKLPARFRGQLHFFDTPIGRLCREVPAILRAAQESYLTSEPNPTYKSADITVSTSAAIDILTTLEIDRDDAKQFGRLLQQQVADELSRVRQAAA